MSFRRKTPFDELVERQLDLLAADERELLLEATAAEEAWNRSDAAGAEEAYGDYQLVVDAIADRLLDTRETYAATVDQAAVDAYRSAFNKAAARRFRRYSSILADLDETA